MNFILLSDMRSERKKPGDRIQALKGKMFLLSFLVLLFFNLSLLTFYCHAEIIDRVVAFIDDIAITLTDLENNYSDMVKLRPEIKRGEVLNTMINRILLLREAKKLRIDAPSKDAVIQEYIELKLKTFIKVTDRDIRDFYEKNRSEFGKTEIDAVRDKIEEFLVEQEVNVRLKRHIEELRSKAYIKIQLTQGDAKTVL